MIIAIVGRKGTGKDTFTDLFLEEYPNVRRVSLSSKLKDITSYLYGWDRNEIEGRENREIREQIDYRLNDKFKGITMRKAMQQIGEKFNEIDPFFWIKIIEDEKFFKTEDIIITDIRTQDQLDYLKNKYNLLSIKIQRDSSDKDIKENNIDYIKTNIIIENNSSLENLRKKIKMINFFDR